LHGYAFDGVDDDESTVGDSECCSDFSGEIDVSRGIDEVDEEFVAFCWLLGLDIENIFVVERCVERNASGFDGNAPFLNRLVFVSCGGNMVPFRPAGCQALAWVRLNQCQPVSRASLSTWSFRDPRLQSARCCGEGTYDVSDDTHVTDVCGVVHQLPELLCREVDHGCKMETEKALGRFLCVLC
jgi:hypothetical protein